MRYMQLLISDWMNMEKKSYKLIISKLDFYKKPRNEETRLFLVYNEDKLIDIEVASLEESLLNSIHIAKVKNIVKNIDAAFLELENGELVYYSLKTNIKHNFTNQKNNTNINEGDDILVQIIKEAAKTKQASASAGINLSGKYIVVGLGESRIKFSSKIKDKNYKREFKNKLYRRLVEDYTSHNIFDLSIEEVLNSIFGNIEIKLRTAAYHEDFDNFEEIYEEIIELTKNLEQIINTSVYRTSPCLIKKGDSEISKLIKSYYTKIYEIVSDDKKVLSLLEKNEDISNIKLRYYEDTNFGLDKIYSLKSTLDNLLDKKVWLNSGAYLIIEQVEALSVIDVNTGKNISGKISEDIIYKTNLEAAIESARQIKLRNISGIILIDFINMDNEKRKYKLLEILNKEFESDKLKAKALDFTRLDLAEITRQRKSKSLREIFYNI